MVIVKIVIVRYIIGVENFDILFIDVFCFGEKINIFKR